ncbi:hypothetical protein CL654_03210 [bacterium]|nr:hypothetical protein [bacterium]|tara:strand:- start:211 stop:774 length:564 start_codon:yes stop_codon:yes gene_type:complete
MKSLPLFVKVIALLVLVGAAVFLAFEVPNNDELRALILQFGYPGILIASIISGFNVIVPIPVIAFAPALVASGLNFWAVIVTMSVGLTLGDLFGYLIGNVGRDLTHGKEQNFKLVRALENLKEHHHFAPYFVMFLYAAFVPLPNEVLVIPLAFLGYKLKYLFPAFFLGNLIFNLLFGYAGVTVFSFF